MYGYHPDTLLEMGKNKMREFHQEREAIKLAKAARKFQPGRFRAVLNQVARFFNLLAPKLAKRFGSGRAMREKAAAGDHT